MSECTDVGTTPRDNRNIKRYVRLLALWAVFYVSGTFVLNMDYTLAAPLRWLIALVPSVFAAIAVGAYWRYLRETDELLRAIELKALALSVSAGFIVWPAVELIEAGVPLDIQLPLVQLVMTGFYAYGVIKGRMDHL